ncbi:MAG: class I SAM-dependent methyltransferase, partial [Bacteroidota bacterium]|nr:class I SAM-dependent methyltransferase [Bacteroidota bacterium]
NLVPFIKRGCQVTGVDIAAIRIEQAKAMFEKNGWKGTLIAEDIFKLKELTNSFDLIIIHDVIEHIDNKEEFLKKVSLYLKPNGLVFIGFPAWQMPFGGHQQICSSRLASNFPYLHLLPKSLYVSFLKCCSEQEATINELLSIKQTKCSIERFLKTVKKANYSILVQQLYFINPHYEVKFGLKPRKLSTLIGKIPFLRNFFCTSCFYLIKPE